MENSTNKYKVLVECMTYNHAPYIEETMNGFINQQTDFPFVCCIVDDASSDETPVVIRHYMEEQFVLEDKKVAYNIETNDFLLNFARHKYNTKCFFAIFFLKYNHYSINKPKYPYLKGFSDNTPYLAQCEGDDYWICHDKLQKQVDFMENHLDYGMVTTASKIYVQGVGMKKGFYGHEYRGFEDLLQGNYILNASVLKRQLLEERYIKEIGRHKEWKMGDWPRILHCAIVSKIGYIDEPMTVYRALPNSASHFESFEKYKLFMESSVAVSKFFISKYHLDANKLFPQLDNWLNRRLLMKACAIRDVDLVNQYKKGMTGLSVKDKTTVLLSSCYFTSVLYWWYRKLRLHICRFTKRLSK